MVITCVNLRIFYLKKNIATWHVTIVSRVKLILVVFNLIPLFIILIEFSPLTFKNNSILTSLI